jgi:hypothetical protein
MTPEAASALRAALRLLEGGAEFAGYAEALLFPHAAGKPALAIIQAGDNVRAIQWLREHQCGACTDAGCTGLCRQ